MKRFFCTHRHPAQGIWLTCLAVLGLILLLLGACAPFKPERRPSPPVKIPAMFSLYGQGPERPLHWWEEFGTADLNTLVAEALAGNFTLGEAWARLRQAEAAAVAAGAVLSPELTFSGSAERARRRIKASSGRGITSTSGSYSAGLVGSYEIDLWGRLRSERQAAVIQAEASREDVYAAAMTLAAEVASRWVEIISQRLQRQLLREQLATNQTYLELVELRFHQGMASAVDVFQQRQVVEQVRAEIPLTESRELLLQHELALLLGKPPQAPVAVTSRTLPAPRAVPAVGIPAAVLAARPDVRAAGLRLQAADWQVAAARAARLPAITLGAGASFGADSLRLLFDNWVLELAANLTAPLADGGRRAAEVERARAEVEEKIWRYRQVVYTAIKEVEDALVQEDKMRAHIKALEREIEAARIALDEARERYRNGLTDYLPVLTQLLAVQRLERDLIQRRTDLVIYRIALHRALGGGWVPPPRSPATDTGDRAGGPHS